MDAREGGTAHRVTAHPAARMGLAELGVVRDSGAEPGSSGDGASGGDDESEPRPLVEVFEQILEGTKEELAAERQPGANPGLFDDELLSYAFLGALENMQMRASWDDRYAKGDVIRNLVAMFVAVRAAYSGRADLTTDWERVADLVDRLAVEEPGFGEADIES